MKYKQISNVISFLIKAKKNNLTIEDIRSFSLNLSKYDNIIYKLKEIQAYRLYLFLNNYEHKNIEELFYNLLSKETYKNNLLFTDLTIIEEIKITFDIPDSLIEEFKFVFLLFLLNYEGFLIHSYFNKMGLLEKLDRYNSILLKIIKNFNPEIINQKTYEKAKIESFFIKELINLAKMPKERPSNKFLDILLYKLNEIAKKKNIDNNLSDFSIPIIKILKSKYLLEFEQVTSFDKTYILRRISEGRKKYRLFFDHPHMG